MLRQLLVIATSSMFCVNAKLCGNVSVRNRVSSFEKHLRGCEAIVGNLEIALFEQSKRGDFANVSFPELTEITGYFLVYRVYNLTTFSHIFPNLIRIRGINLFKGYSFVLYEVLQLEEIGLPSLKGILNGSARIERCPHLCDVNTLNWTNIENLANHKYFNIKQHHCGLCPERCKEMCWDKFHCQERGPDNCHPECVGCTEPNSPHKCIECKSYRDNGTCLSDCPKEKFRLPMLLSCLTDGECRNISFEGPWWPHQRECVKECPPGFMKGETNDSIHCVIYRKECSGIEINSTDSSDVLDGCTHINGSLIIHFHNATEVGHLYKNLKLIEEIDDFFIIRRSGALTSLEFLEKLRIIHGKKLYNRRHSLVAFQNQNLYKLWEHNHTIEVKRGTISFHDNFDLCFSTIRKFADEAKLNFTEYDVSPHSNGDSRVCNYIELNITVVNVNSTNVTLVWENVTHTRNLTAPVGYLLFYTMDSLGNVTIYDKYDDSSDSIWENTLVADNITHQIVNLNPFTQYAYYIRLYSNSSEKNGQTKIRHVTTLSDDPTELLHLDAISTASDSIILNWDYPLFPNGIPDHYELVVYFERDDEVFVAGRNYCKHPHYGLTCCHSPYDPVPSGKFEFTCDRLNIIMNADSKPGGCKNYMYSIEDHNKTIESDNGTVYFVPQHKIAKRSVFPANETYLDEVPISDPNITTFTVKSLKHFGMYVFVLKVCNKETKTECSSPVMTFQRTLPKEDADDIPPGLSARIRNSDVVVAWSEPRQPNSMIVSYQIEYKSTDPHNSNLSTECLTREEFVKLHHEYRIRKLPPGQYVVRVKATSLAGPGKFGQYVKFEIPSDSGSSIALIIGIIFVITAIFLGAFHYYRRYYKRSVDRETLISDASSDYAGPSYVEDEWEMGRADVQIYNKIAQGSFVTVYTGLIKPQNLPCAVKSTTRTDLHEKISFLNETCMMKWCSGAHHVVKLLGVVSKAPQPLVLMELVSEGDLKSYLRSLRFSSITTTITEMCRMAAEVADGMVYLSSKRFVHRDLAARNCMVAGDRTVKIGDYGISKDIHQEDYGRNETGTLIPVRWMAPESLANGGFTADSDVWSYGVLLWEIVTFAEQPYETLSSEAVSDFVTNHGTLQRPAGGTGLLCEIMERCWKWRPNDRPLFTDIVGWLESRIGQHFSLVSFYHSTEGDKYRKNPRLRVFNAPALSEPFSRSSSVRWNALDDIVDI